MLKIKIIAGLFILGLIGFVTNGLPEFSSRAQSDGILDEIAEYKTWTKFTKEPIVFSIDDAALVGG